MCEYCEKYGDGNVWYLNPKNYGRQLYRAPTPGYIPDAIGWRKERDGIWDAYFEAAAARAPEAEALRVKLDTLMGQNEPGQVVPLKDCFKIVEIAQPLVIMSCICRKQMRGADERSPEEYSCLALGVGMFKWERWPERYRGGVKFVSVDECKEWLTKFDKKGMMHLIMCYGTSYGGRPFIGGICSCDYPDCYEIRNRCDYNLPHHLPKAHWVASVNFDKCNGCGVCASRCSYGALKMEKSRGKANIDAYKCFGCGLCETGCPTGAIQLVWRESIPALKEVW